MCNSFQCRMNAYKNAKNVIPLVRFQGYHTHFPISQKHDLYTSIQCQVLFVVDLSMENNCVVSMFFSVVLFLNTLMQGPVVKISVEMFM